MSVTMMKRQKEEGWRFRSWAEDTLDVGLLDTNEHM
jgi:hypothetical protein